MFNNLLDAINWVNHQKKDNKRYSLDDLKEALALLGNPEKDLKIIHVGGTNGKGSTCAYLQSILKEHKLKVGLYVSPFVVKFNERISVDGKYIEDDELLKYINKLYDFNESFKINHDQLAFFEILTLIAFLYFNEKKCDICVLEVGLGGRLDATNVCSPLVSAVTNIQKDHTEQLGKTYKKILSEKLGIVKQCTPFATCIKKQELISDIKERTNSLNSKLFMVRNIRNIVVDQSGTSFTYKGVRYHSSLIGIHQAYNASLAIEIIHILDTFYKYDINVNEVKKGLEETFWPGRFEILNGFILDGGHNPEGQLALKNTLKEFTNKNIITFFTAMKDKDLSNIIPIVDSYSNQVIYTEISYPRCENAINLYNLSKSSNKMYFDDPYKAFNYAKSLKNDNNIIIFTGSLYFISFIRDLILKNF